MGDRVRVKEDFVPGHIRMPGYIRGKEGVVVSISPAYPYPDAHGHGLESAWQRSFDVRFSSRHLWPDGAEDAEVQVGVFHGYLDKVTLAQARGDFCQACFQSPASNGNGLCFRA